MYFLYEKTQGSFDKQMNEFHISKKQKEYKCDLIMIEGSILF